MLTLQISTHMKLYIISTVAVSPSTIQLSYFTIAGSWRLDQGKHILQKNMLNQRVEPDFVRYTGYTPNGRMAN